MKSRKLLLVRHGRTDWNDAHRWQGRTDVPLNEEGETQANRTALRLAGWNPDLIVSSPLLRARRTAEMISEHQTVSRKIELDEDLVEIGFGQWEGLSVAKVADVYAGIYQKWRQDPSRSVPPGGETLEEVMMRLGRVLKRILSCEAEKMIVVSHGGVMRAVIVLLFGIDSSLIWRMRLDNCAFVGVEIGDVSCSLSFFNDSLHIQMDAEGAEKLPLPF